MTQVLGTHHGIISADGKAHSWKKPKDPNLGNLPQASISGYILDSYSGKSWNPSEIIWREKEVNIG